VEPGVEVRFDQHTGLEVDGTLKALGTATQPITFTSTSLTPTPGWWSGIYLRYGTGVLDYVTTEYGGYNQPAILISIWASIRLAQQANPQQQCRPPQLVWWDRVSVEFSQIISNTGYGIWNDHPEDVLMAVNNSWGSRSGPVADGNCNPDGTGSRVTAGWPIVRS